MAWSTRELAELAGTTVRAVRHYHQVGLLVEPERRANGYKRYGVTHLVRLLRIKRLVDLGFSLPQIAELGESDEHPEEALRALDTEVAADIERLQRVRAELRSLLQDSAPTDLPAELGEVAGGANLSEADRSFIAVMSRLLSPAALLEYRDMLVRHSDEPVLTEFDTLPPDVDEAARADLAARMFPYVREHAMNPGLWELKSRTPEATRLARLTVTTAITDLYSPAQIDVMQRINELINAAADGEEST